MSASTKNGVHEANVKADSVQLVKEECMRDSTVSGVSVQESCEKRTEELLNALNLPAEKLTEHQYQLLVALVKNYSDVFALTDKELGCTSIVQHVIDTGDHSPIRQQPYRVPVVHREKISQIILDMKEQGVIRPSQSRWASPVILVPKKDGQLRFCVDYRHLNSITKKDVYPLPHIDEILDALGKTSYFSSLDLASGYWQVELDPESLNKSAFTTYRGHFEFTCMPFGLCNAPATFQRLMTQVLADLEWGICFVYLDDILVASQTFEEHLKHLESVFKRLRKAGLRLKPRECLLL